MAQHSHSTCSCGSSELSYKPFLCKIESIKPLTPLEKQFHLVREDGKPFGHKPGQFVMVTVPGVGEAAISVSSSPTRGNHLQLGIRMTGELTKVLHGLKEGDTVFVRGPFGTFFDTDAMKGKNLLLISGGCGLAPMRSLIQYVEDSRSDYKSVNILYGAKSPDDRLYKDELDSWSDCGYFACGYTVDSAPDTKCWNMNVGLITTLIPPLEIDPKNTVAVIVGPPIMYKFVIMELKKKGLTSDDIVVSLERYMRCGVGKCGHCVIDHLYCCLDGPVFKLSQVENVKGAL